MNLYLEKGVRILDSIFMFGPISSDDDDFIFSCLYALDL